MGCKKCLLRIFGISAVIIVAVLLGPNTLPQNVKFTEFHVAPNKNLGKGFTFNDLLNNAERLFENEIKGPEDFEIINGELYTTLHGGYVAKVFEDQVIPVVKFGQPCEGWWEESKCGRPLGLKALDNNHLIVADAYYGIFKYNVNNGKITTLVDKETIIDGLKSTIFNSIEIGKDNSVYWTSSSSDFSLENGLFSFLADGSGRLIKLDPKTNKNVVLMKNLYFANGVALSPEEDFILVAETGHSRIHKYYLKGPRKSTSEIFIDGLPGMPDNLRSNGEGGFFVPLVVARSEKAPSLPQVIAPFPLLRKFLAQLLSYIEIFLETIYKIYPNYFLKRGLHFVGHLESMLPFLPPNATLLEVDVNGKVIRTYQGSDSSIKSLCDVIIHDGYLYLGSPYNNFLGRVKLSKLKRPFPKSQSSTPSNKPSTPSVQSSVSTKKASTPAAASNPKTTQAPPPVSTTKPNVDSTTSARPKTTKPPPETRTTSSTGATASTDKGSTSRPSKPNNINL